MSLLDLQAAEFFFIRQPLAKIRLSSRGGFF